MTHHIDARRDSAVLRITLDRGDAGNLLSADMAGAIQAALRDLDDDVRVVLLQASGADFCRGRESPMPSRDARPTAESLRRIVTGPPVALYDAIKAVPVPTVSVVRGLANGVGCALAAACDLTLCAESATFVVPELERDVPPTLVMSALMGRVPLKTIAHLVLTRQPLAARDALAAGLVTQVCPDAALDEAVAQVVAGLAACSPVTLRAVKTLLQLGPQVPQVAGSALAAYVGATALSARFG